MVYGRQNITAWFEMQGKPYFAIFRKSEAQSGNFVFHNRDRENETMETAKAYLDRCLHILGSGDFFMYCNNDQKQASSKGRSETFFTLTLSEAPAIPPQQQAVAGIGAITPDQVDALAEKKFNDLMQKKELEELRKKNVQLEKENRALQARTAQPMNKFLEGLSPYIGNIAEALGMKKMATPLPISGVKPDAKPDDNNITDPDEETEANEVENPEAAQAAVNEFLTALSEKYPDTWVEILEKLTNAIVNDPGKIDMAIKFL